MTSGTPDHRPALNAVDWGVASRPKPGQTVSGDLHLVQPLEHGVLLAVVDGLGHGDEATAAARLAVEQLERHAQEPVTELYQRCHQALTRTRGVVMTVTVLDLRRNTLTWLGVGNVEDVLLRADTTMTPATESVLLRGGVVGYRLPALHASVIPIMPGDLIIFSTDGIRGGFTEWVNPNDKPQQIADRILDRHFKGNDDGLVLVARYLGPDHE
jgi:phosphoserine phosphatase RsbX